MIKKTGRKTKRTTSLLLHNGMIESRHNLSIMEIKTLFAMAYKIQNHEGGQNIIEYSKEPNDETLYYTASEISSLVGIPKGSFQLFEKVCERLMSTIITIRDPAKPKNWEKMNFLTWAKYEDGIIALRPNKAMFPFYLKLTQNYTPLELTAIMNFKSSYTIRVYTLIKQYKNLKPVRTFKIEELKMLLGIEKMYTSIKDFKLRVLESAKNELNEQFPELNFDYELIKSGRSYRDIKFIFNFSAVSEEIFDIKLHSEAFECFTKMDLGRQCAYASAPANNNICSYCFKEIKARY